MSVIQLYLVFGCPVFGSPLQIYFFFAETEVRAPPPRELNELEATLSNIERDCCEVTGTPSFAGLHLIYFPKISV